MVGRGGVAADFRTRGLRSWVILVVVVVVVCVLLYYYYIIILLFFVLLYYYVIRHDTIRCGIVQYSMRVCVSVYGPECVAPSFLFFILFLYYYYYDDALALLNT